MLSYTIFFMLNICFDSLLVSNEVKNVFPASGVYKKYELFSERLVMNDTFALFFVTWAFISVTLFFVYVTLMKRCNAGMLYIEK